MHKSKGITGETSYTLYICTIKLQGNYEESYTEGCLKQTCKNGVWRPSLEMTVCCFEREAFPPNTTITAITTKDGCTKSSMECIPDGDKAKMVLKLENSCNK